MRIGVFLRGPLEIRNWETTGVLDKLGRELNSIVHQVRSHPKGLGFRIYTLASSFFQDVSTHKFAARSRSFRYRIERRRRGYKLFGKMRLLFEYLVSFIPAPFFIFLLNILAKFVRYDELQNFDILLIPSFGHDPIAEFVILKCKQYQVHSYLIIENWDNLSSKSVLLFTPQHIGVISEQTREHAEKIQSIHKEKITVLGSARFECYRSIVYTTPFNFNYILFAGCNLPFDEISILKVIDRWAQTKNNLRIIYRPHPWRQPRVEGDFDSHQFKRTEIDPQLLNNFSQKKFNVDFQPTLSYYNGLLKGAQFIVTPLSTIILEGLICGRGVVALATDDKVNFATPGRNLEECEHFRGVANHPGIFLVTDDEKLLPTLERAYVAGGEHKFSGSPLIYWNENKTFTQLLAVDIKHRFSDVGPYDPL